MNVIQWTKYHSLSDAPSENTEASFNERDAGPNHKLFSRNCQFSDSNGIRNRCMNKTIPGNFFPGLGSFFNPTEHNLKGGTNGHE